MAGANALEEDGSTAGPLPQARRPEQAKEFKSFHNYVALPRSEAFRIEYWALEEAKLQRMPPEREFSRKIALVVGGGSGIGREVALQLARARRARGGGRSERRERRSGLGRRAAARSSGEAAMAARARSGVARQHRRRRCAQTVLPFGGVDIVVNTAAIYPTPEPGSAASRGAVGEDAADQRHGQPSCWRRRRPGS